VNTPSSVLRPGPHRPLPRAGAVLQLALGLAALGLAGPACSRSSGDGGGRPKPPVVRQDGRDLTFFWFDSTGSVHRVERISDVPLNARDRVLVQPLDPRAATGAWAFIADLRQPGSDGVYPVQVLTREAYSTEVRARMAAGHPETKVASASEGPSAPSAPGALPTAGKQVVIYLTPGCPHCRRAKEWMTKLGIPFVEHDIEQDAAAARWVLQNTGSTAVPVFQVGSRILQGFNQEALRRAVREELGIELL
jgi:glutaredoxin 3